ncbi:hypothetical protein TNCV_3129391 [Trichonephila clavipes]|nr:hypothetical protein TNCV_3129391 [Trichonephila clavipes]
MVISGSKVVSQLWNQLQTSDTITRKIDECRHCTSTSALDRYLPLSARRYRRTTAPQLARHLAVVSGRRISKEQDTAVLKNLSCTPVVQLCVSF